MKRIIAVLVLAVALHVGAAEEAGMVVTRSPEQTQEARPATLERLSKSLVGRWIWQKDSFSQEFTHGASLIGIVEEPDGSFVALLTLKGIGTTCFADKAPVKGRNRGDSVFVKGIVGSCGKGTFELKKVSKDTYEGPYEIENGNPGIRKLMLSAPR